MSTPFEDGPEDAKICFVAEAPSYEELKQGRPLCGPSGNLFERCLHAAGITRAEVRILNTWPGLVSKPKDNSAKIFDADGTLLWAAKGLTEAGRAAAAPTLERMRTCSANVFVTLGGPALSLAVDARPVSKWRGSILEGFDGRKVIPSLHPAYSLRGAYEARYYLISDFKKARTESAFPDIRLTPRRLLIDPTFDEALTFLRRCLAAPAVNTDIELLGGQIDCFGLAVEPTEAMCISLLDERFEHRWTLEEEAQIWSLYAQLLSAPHITKINQNIAFDLAVLLQLNNIVTQGPLGDPMIAHGCMYPYLDKDLGTITSMYTDLAFFKNQGVLHDSDGVANFERRWRYNCLDNCASLESFQKLDKMLDENGFRRTYELDMAKIASCLYMMTNGVRVDRAGIARAKTQAEHDIEGLRVKLGETLGRAVITEAPKNAKERKAAAGALNINSPAQLTKLFYDEMKLKPYIGKNGKPVMDDKALARIYRRDGVPAAKLLQDYRKLSKMDSTYYSVGIDADDRLRCSYNIRGTKFGRLSSSETIFGTGFNNQNIPPKFKEFMETDYVG